VYEEAPGFRLAPRVNSQKQQRCLIVIPSTCPYQVLAHCVEVGHAEAAVHDEVFVRREDVLAGVLLGACRAVLEGEPAAYGGGGGARGGQRGNQLKRCVVSTFGERDASARISRHQAFALACVCVCEIYVLIRG